MTLKARGQAEAAIVAVMGMIMALGLILLGSDPSSGKPRVVIKFTPTVAAGPSVFTFRAELGGRQEEKYHCPAVEWTWTDGSRSMHEEDCLPFGEGEYPRLWVARKRLGEGCHKVAVRLIKNGKTLLMDEVYPKVGSCGESPWWIGPRH